MGCFGSPLVRLGWDLVRMDPNWYGNPLDPIRTPFGSLMDQFHKLCRIFTRVIQEEAIAAGHINGIPRQCWMYIEKQGVIPCRNKLDILTIKLIEYDHLDTNRCLFIKCRDWFQYHEEATSIAKSVDKEKYYQMKHTGDYGEDIYGYIIVDWD